MIRDLKVRENDREMLQNNELMKKTYSTVEV